MSIKYEIHTISNSEGTGQSRRFARIYEHMPMTAAELEGHIQSHSGLTRGMVRAVLMSLRDCMVHSLTQGRRFYLPEIGYFSLAVDLDTPDGQPDSKVRGSDISVRGIHYRPETSLLVSARLQTRFERAPFTTQSQRYTEAGLVARIADYLAQHPCLTRRDMELSFGLRQTTALRWLRRLTAAGVLRRLGAAASPVYVWGETAETAGE